MTTAIVVPARWGSTRLPGKPLVRIAGRSLLHRVIDLARRSAGDDLAVGIVVATDDDRIAEHAAEVGCPSVVTAEAIDTGSGRAYAAACLLQPTPTHVVNLQGDAPLISPATVRAVLGALRRPDAQCVTPVTQLSWSQLAELERHKLASPFSGTTCIRDAAGRALWFSKVVIPAIRRREKRQAAMSLSPVYRHLGLYGYTIDTLRRFSEAPPSFYEELEGLEQLRLIDLGVRIDTVEVTEQTGFSGVDTAHDVALAEALIARHGDPYRG